MVGFVNSPNQLKAVAKLYEWSPTRLHEQAIAEGQMAKLPHNQYSRCQICPFLYKHEYKGLYPK